jgi:hypothetical protein
VLELVDHEPETIDLGLELVALGTKLLKLLWIIIVRILIPRTWQKFICAGIRNQVISLWVVDLSIVSCIALQLTIEIIWTDISNDPLH